MEAIRIVTNGILCSIALWGHSTCIVAIQWLSIFIWPFSLKYYYKFHAHLMRQWAQNLFQVMHMFAPGELIITFDESCTEGNSEFTEHDTEALEKILTRNKHGEVVGISFPEKLIMIANHQIYADWIYVWFLAYLSKAHGSLKIMLKYSLSLVPIYGIRKLEYDKDNIINNLQKTKKRNRPLWLVLFPEGTVISDDARQKSKNYATKLHMDDFKFTLLPRTTGLMLCRDTLDNSVEWLYDLTIAYPGIEPGENPEDVMTMKRIFCEGNGPHKIHIHIRRYRLDTLPSGTENFTQWLLERWAEKDKRLVYFNQHGSFPEESDLDNDRWLGHHRTIKVQLALQHVLRECFGYWFYFILYIPIIFLIRYLFTFIYATYFQ
ncbi:hypothetical protein CU098_007294 [Rhizopus stolonifer]|uniref:Phospholipid/glycerol acyltransferase domain-containing protein n=1 Tax=Rhizopus stolonifer TaxID=4846 RepID=A0A367JZ09_RHIST|nr:hypothetical protein CU098_007294 [Rhizopus stolonifer]